MMNIDQLAMLVREQADRLFPARTESSMFLKLFSEIGEMVENPSDHDEIADVFIMLLDHAAIKGVDLEYAIHRKMAVNEGRHWVVNPLGVMRHEK